MELSWQWLLLLVHSNQFMTVCLIFPFLFLQNQMLDYSKRSRSGKFRLVTKFKKEKNNKNKETHSSMGLPGTKSAHSLCLFVTSVWSHHYLFLVCFLTHPLLFHLHLPLLAGLVNHLHVAKQLIAPFWVMVSLYHANIPEQEQEVPSEEFSSTVYRFSGMFQRVLREVSLRILAF